MLFLEKGGKVRFFKVEGLLELNTSRGGRNGKINIFPGAQPADIHGARGSARK